MKKFFAMILALSMLALVLCSCAKTKVEPKVTRGDLPTIEPTNVKAAGDLLKDFVATEVTGKDADEKFKSGMLDFAVKLMQNTLDEDKKKLAYLAAFRYSCSRYDVERSNGRNKRRI